MNKAAADKEGLNCLNNKFQEILSHEMEQTSYHYGHPNLNVATLAGVLRISLEELSSKYNIKLSDSA